MFPRVKPLLPFLVFILSSNLANEIFFYHDALKNIVAWFDNQTEVDVGQGLEKVKLGAELVKKTKARLSEIANEFEEIQREIERDSTQKSSKQITSDDSERFNVNNIPF